MSTRSRSDVARDLSAAMADADYAAYVVSRRQARMDELLAHHQEALVQSSRDYCGRRNPFLRPISEAKFSQHAERVRVAEAVFTAAKAREEALQQEYAALTAERTRP